jgi:predicted nucleic acid-binding protein
MPVVSDASPLILLAKIRRLDLLKKLYSEVLIPKKVKEEVTKQEVPPIISGIREGWIKVKEVELSSEVKEMGRELGLHEGEIYALSLALHANVKQVLADDKLARVGARILGLQAIGCLGVVMKAYEMDVITRNEAISAIQELVKAGLWISPEVLGEVLTSLED